MSICGIPGCNSRVAHKHGSMMYGTNGVISDIVSDILADDIISEAPEELIRDLKKQLREVEQDRDHYKALCETLKDAPKPEYG